VAKVESGDFAGWEATARADFPARLLLELDSGSIGRILPALDAIIIDHNMPNSAGKLAETLADVDPVWGLVAISEALGLALAALPPR
jgi:hypothetical protein